MKILILNVQQNFNKNLKPFLCSCLQNREYDIFCLQEANQGILNYMLDLENYDYHTLSTTHPETNETMELVTIYKKELTLKKSKLIPFSQFSNTQILSKGALISEFQINSSQNHSNLTIANIHLHCGGGFKTYARLKSLKYLEKFLDKQHNTQKIICGDFNNSFPFEAKFFDYILRKKWINASQKIKYTFDSRYVESRISKKKAYKIFSLGGRILPKAKLDHVYLTKNFRSSYKIYTLKNPIVSDHLPLIIETHG